MSASDRLVLVLALALGACASAPGIPETPDVSHLLSAYATPSGTVDASEPASWLEAGALQVDLVGGGKAQVLLTRIAANALKAVDQASLPDGRQGVVQARIDGVATLVVPCGYAHETADVSVEIVDGAISPLMWGTSHACPLWQGAGYRESYDGAFAMYRYPGADVLVRVDGTLTRTGADIHLDFRLSNGRLETRIAAPTGDLIVTRDRSDVAVRAANGTFRCNAKQLGCVRED